MSALYWIKLYTEILNDPKMATLPDRLWRRVIELFLCAGHLGRNGHLPETGQLAWLLRMQTDDLELDLKQIAMTGIIQRNGTGWVVAKFEQRQSATPDNERKRQERERKRASQYYKDEVTDLSRSVTQSRAEQSRTESETEEGASALPPALPIQAQTFLDHGGKFPAGKLKDGATRKSKAVAFMVEKIPKDPESLARWGMVVENYVLTWSAASYTVMVNDYFLQNRIPGQARKNGAGPLNVQDRNREILQKSAAKRGINLFDEVEHGE